MRIFWRILIAVSFLSFINIAHSEVQDKYFFPSLTEEQRFHHLLNQFRCVVCQNQSLAESNAPLALDLKNEIYHQVRLGFSEQQIKNYFIHRYGEYILFQPAVNKNTIVLWLGPVIFLVGASSIMFFSIWRQSQPNKKEQQC